MSCRFIVDVDGERCPRQRGRHDDPLPKGHPVDCAGCLPCRHRHCGVCCAHLDETEIGTCVLCTGQARRNLMDIADLYGLLPEHIVSAARNAHLIAADPIPGGDALVHLGHGSWGDEDDGETWNAGDPDVPVYLLGWWASTWRRSLNLPPGHYADIPRHLWGDNHLRQWRPSPDIVLDRAYRFLMTNLGWAARNLPVFWTFSREIERVRYQLEDLLSAGLRNAHGVSCFGCGTTLEREYRPPMPCRHAVEAERTGVTTQQWLRVLDSYPELGIEHDACDQGGLKDPASDTGWYCPRCRREYSTGEYTLAVKAAYAEHAPVLNATELADRLDVTAVTVWQWAQRGHVRRRGRSSDGRTLYDVGDAIRQHMKAEKGAEAG